MKKIVFTFLGLFFLLPFQIQATKRPQNVVIMIGDGMGLAQIYAGMVVNGNHLQFERFKSIGFSKTYSANNFTTDSGAGGTAIACGVKTNNYMIGMNPDSTKAESILEVAKKHKLSTGVVVACALTHATPADFIAHQPNRNMYEEIAADYLNSGVDVAIGGGRKYFEERNDDRNITAELKSKGYKIASSLDEVKNQQDGKVIGLLYEDQVPAVPARGKMLPESAVAALNILDNNKKGFVLMVEGSQIDWACHDNNAEQLTKEMLDFDETVGKVLDYAQVHKNTLVIVTADHETGGLTMPGGDMKRGTFNAVFSIKGHSGVLVPVFTFGPGADEFQGFMENSSFKTKIEKLLKF
ncbi:MAG: alkaline phosphatase [Paludibacter sp.]|nr:alkaline phosphatase [Paludibacter sp.]